MIIIGHELVKYEPLGKVLSKDDIKNIQPNEIVFFKFNKELLEYCTINKILFAVEVFSIKEAIIANAVNAKYIIVQKNLATEIQNLADYYLFDSKIAILIKSEDEITEAASLKIDCVILPNGVRNANL